MKISFQVLFFAILSTLFVGCCSKPEPICFAVFADIQYADIPPTKVRFYHRSLELAKETTAAINASHARFVIGLGDLIDRNYDSYQPVFDVLSAMEVPIYHVAGNHDFNVLPEYKLKAYETLGMPSRYFIKQFGDWDFIFLDSNVLTTYAYLPDSEEHKFFGDLRKEKYSYAKVWNGGFASEQLEWLSDHLAVAEKSGRKVALFFHTPVYDDPVARGGAVDGPDLLEVIARYPDTVKFVLAGHQHEGGYRQVGNTHHLTIRGQIEAASPTYAIVEITDTTVTVSGFGEQPGHVWEL